MKWIFFLVSFVPCVYGDVSYDVITKSLAGGPAASNQSRISIRGSKMIQDGDASRTIIDTSRKTITELNLTDKTYRVLTFEQIDQEIQKAKDSLSSSGAPNMLDQMKEIHWSFEINDTHNKKLIDQIECEEIVFSATGTFPATQKIPLIFKMNSSFCLSNAVKGADEIKSFTEKFDLTNPINSMNNLKGMLGDLSAGLEALEKKLAEKGGVSLSNAINIRMKVPSPNPDQPSMEMPTMEIETVQSNFSNAPVSPDIFVIPADFQQIK